MCGDPWPLADRKTVSLFHLSIGVEGRGILNCKNPHIMIDTLSIGDFWEVVEATFIRSQNISFDLHFFLITNNSEVTLSNISIGSSKN